MKWFVNPKTLEDLKAQYKRLAIANHPDRGGRTEDMQEINAEYDLLFARLKNVHETAEGKTYTASTDSAETPDAYRAVIDMLITLDGIDIELCGSWIWVTGNTYAVKDQLKAAGLRFASKKRAWYWHPAEEAKKTRGTLSMEQIRERYGSERIATTGTLKLQHA